MIRLFSNVKFKIQTQLKAMTMRRIACGVDNLTFECLRHTSRHLNIYCDAKLKEKKILFPLSISLCV